MISPLGRGSSNLLSTATHLRLTNNQNQKSSQSTEDEVVLLISSSVVELKQIHIALPAPGLLGLEGS